VARISGKEVVRIFGTRKEQQFPTELMRPQLARHLAAILRQDEHFTEINR
jgi:hypothetical protein